MAEQHGVDGWAWNAYPRSHVYSRRHYFRSGRALCRGGVKSFGGREVSDVRDPKDCRRCREMRDAEKGFFPSVEKTRAAEAARFSDIRTRLVEAEKRELLDTRWGTSDVGRMVHDVRWLLERLGEEPKDA